MSAENTKSKNWWSNPAYIAAIAAILAIVPPMTAAITGFYQAKVEENRHLHEIKLKYLQIAIDPNQKPEYHESVLTFLVSTMDEDEPMKAWANDRLRNIEQVIKLQHELEIAHSELNRTRQIATTAQRAVTKNTADAEQLRQRLNNQLTEQRNKVAGLINELKQLHPSRYTLEGTRQTRADYVGTYINAGDREIIAQVSEETPGNELNASYTITNGDCQYADEDVWMCAASIPDNLELIIVEGESLETDMIVGLSELDVTGETLFEEYAVCKPTNGTCLVEFKLPSRSLTLSE